MPIYDDPADEAEWYRMLVEQVLTREEIPWNRGAHHTTSGAFGGFPTELEELLLSLEDGRDDEDVRALSEYLIRQGVQVRIEVASSRGEGGIIEYQSLWGDSDNDAHWKYVGPTSLVNPLLVEPVVYRFRCRRDGEGVTAELTTDIPLVADQQIVIQERESDGN